jgi:hypothetical protein
MPIPDMEENIAKNAQMTIEQLRPISQIDFGYNRDSVKWLEGYIERLRQSGQLQPEAMRQKLISVLGSFLGECMVLCYGGSWVKQDGMWGVSIGDNFIAYPFNKLGKQMDNGLEDSIDSFFTSIPKLLSDYVHAQETPTKKPWWKFW